MLVYITTKYIKQGLHRPTIVGDLYSNDNNYYYRQAAATVDPVFISPRAKWRFFCRPVADSQHARSVFCIELSNLSTYMWVCLCIYVCICVHTYAWAKTTAAVSRHFIAYGKTGNRRHVAFCRIAHMYVLKIRSAPAEECYAVSTYNNNNSTTMMTMMTRPTFPLYLRQRQFSIIVYTYTILTCQWPMFFFLTNNVFYNI